LSFFFAERTRRRHCFASSGKAAPGHEPCTPANRELEACNLGYAQTCPRLPKERSCDAIRFGVARDSNSLISLRYVMETGHQPAGDGSLEYDCVVNGWISTYPEARIQKMAECFLQSYLERKDRGGIPSRASAAVKDSVLNTEGTELHRVDPTK